ncbi:hypothetical protein F2P45_34260 [Massilia sp. CCM 8733]|uniref:Uncharacterized protein n=1 Tax=Massilia mucilaginosa TaxID=2609282 RepID=A0ABX0P3Z6_9BURK|nr:hypothetical protein [Massilia mucilaginosa]
MKSTVKKSGNCSRMANGEWRKAMRIEIDDVRRVAREAGEPKIYNEAMREMLEYFKCLEKNGLLK